MAQQLHVYLFGDQTFEVSTKLPPLLHSKSSPLLEAFFEQAYQGLRSEITQLPARERDTYPRFSSIAELLSWRNRQEKLHQPIETILTCIYQLAQFISEHDGFGRTYPSPTETCMSGLCTGALAAAAVSCCKTVSELIPVAVQTVIVALRTGQCALNAANAVDQSEGNWSTVLTGLSQQEVSDRLQEFSNSHRLPITSQPYVSAYAENWVTISGPPRVLGLLRHSENFAKVHPRQISVFAPYHAPHLFTKVDIEGILSTTPEGVWGRYGAALPVVSSTTGKLVEGDNLRRRLEAALVQILLEPVQWNQLTQGVASVVSSSGASQFTTSPVGTNADAALGAALNSTAGLSNGIVPERVPQTTDVESDTSKPAGSTGRSKIAIVGMSGRYPSADNNEEFWDLIFRGLDVHKVVPDLHWSAKTHVDPTGKKKNTSATPYGCWLETPAAFDAQFFNMSPREAPQVDPAQRIALMTAYEALEQAGIVADATSSTRKDRVGVFYGVTSNDWMETNSSQNIDTYFIPGGNRAFIPGRLNYFFKFSGPSYSVDTACSSSLASLHVACNSLWRGDIDTAITGGTNVLTNPDFTAGLDRGHFLSRTGNCKTFDDGADGYCRGEGVGTVILKRLEDAVVDKDPIHGVILGTYTNHSAEAESITRPHVGAQRDIFQKILSSCGVDRNSVSYVEMHGTGTQAGDAREMSSVLDTFAPTNTRHQRQPTQALHIGSVKANIGHGEAASGVSALTKVLLMMRNNTLPPHCGIKTKINSRFPPDLESRNVHIAKEPIPWRRAGNEPRRAFVNNFSAAGGNSAVLLEDKPDEVEIEGTDPRTTHLVAVSARSAASMAANLKSLMAYIQGQRDHDKPLFLPQLSYTTTARRMHHLHRVMLAGSTTEEIKRHLEAAISRGDGATRPKAPPKLTFAFTGQGAQYVGMARTLYRSFRQFQDDITRFDELSKALGFSSFKDIIVDDSGRDIPEFSPVAVQLATVCIQMALSRLLISWNVMPDMVVGQSLGEYAALNVAGVLSDADTIFLVGRRAQLLEERCTVGTHSMLVVKAGRSEIQTALAGAHHEIACVNSPEETVLAGPNAQVEELQQTLNSKGFRSKTICVPFAYHSSQVDPILSDLEAVAGGVTFHKPTIPVISPLLSKVIEDVGIIGPDYLRRHCRQTVNFADALRSAKENGSIKDGSFVLEIGPHSVVTGMVKGTLGPAVTAVATLQRNRDEWKTLTDMLSSLYCAGIDLRWHEYHRDFAAAHKVLELPAYKWNLKDYWIQYSNDWSLRKGDTPLVALSVAPLESTTIHKVVEESKDAITVESDMARADFNPLVQGHEVDGVPLCTPSVYADIALTVGKYVLDRYHPEMADRLVDVSNMTVMKALIAKPQGPQLLRTFVTVDWAAKKAKARFCSYDKKGQPTVEHSNCEIHFTDRARQEQLEQTAPEKQARMVSMRKELENGPTQRFNRAMVYKMISPLAQFHSDYRPLDEVIMDSDTYEVTSRVTFKGVEAQGTFHTHPAFLDGLTQAGGFVMNCNDKNDLDAEVFVNHGWESLQVYEPLSKEQTYWTFCQMSERDSRKYQGDVTVFDESGKVVASYNGIVFQGVPRRVLRFFLTVDGVKPPRGQPQPKANAAPASKPSMPSAPAVSPKTTAVNVPAPATKSKPSLAEPAMKIISEESGVSMSDLTDDAVFADIGIDSLLALVINSRFREELNLDLEFDDIFTRYTCVKELKGFLGQYGGSEDPAPSDSLFEEPRAVRDAMPEIPQQAPALSATENVATSLYDSAAFDAALGIISEESGLALSDLTDDCVFADIGIDSLLSLVIVSRFREELELDMEMDSIHTEYPTVKDLKALFKSGRSGSESESESTCPTPSVQLDRSDPENSGTPSSATSQDSDSEPDAAPLKKEHAPVPAATSVLLQGIPKFAEKVLFLFPDGAGSATSYSGIPRLGSKVAVIGLNSPYYKIPELFKCTLDGLIDSYINEVRRRQPTGPYHLGGWSAGGILAYRAAQKLINAGETVQSLLLIDSPVPKGLDRLPQHFYDYCNKLQLFGQPTTPGSGGAAAKPPAWLVPHFNATIDTLHEYFATPLPEGKTPRTSIIWASESVMDGKKIPKMPPHPDDTEGMKFLTEARTDFGANGWEALFPGGTINLDRTDGTNHFEMMRGEHGAKLAEFIGQALA
ncbi:conidial pigment polyketide synthase PksP/Alb1 [Aspergillus steynii IBT 23096]|uniref:Conidial pigment polyketide synthase PksP/Alb1 n=1 Tax=Aspergillus steynii IBT 23096 TaxID=1392250 RepID=A0A2I2G6E6_9EURO|nr:conidial pigment polyketide synthase PksP/Alb1 [Aspergillus steynii IBT 23096]PLB48450.1 conidial pigment polyketide synthase PksP/Alb1 [Aspergillus steynii IBT 23096]